MASQVIGRTRIFWLVAATVVALILVVACSGPADRQSGNQQESSSEGNSASVSSGGGQPNQASGSGSESSSASLITGYDACASYSWLAQGGAGGFSYQSGDGSRVDSSKTPSSDFAADVGKFAEESLEDVLDGDVSPACFIESKTPNSGSVYVALNIPDDPPTGAASAVGEAMKKRGANVLGSYSSTSPQGTYDIVSVQGLPVETPDDLPVSGGLYFITNQEGIFQAVMVVSYTDIGNQASSGSGNAPAAPSSTRAPVQSPTVVAVAPRGMVGSINSDLKPALEQALKTGLIVQTFSQTSAGGTNSAIISYIIEGQLPAGVEPSESLSDVAEDLGGTVTSALASSEGYFVFFEDLKSGEFSVDGSFMYLPNDSQVAVTLTSVDTQ